MSMKTVRRRTEYWMVNGNRLHNYKYSICARIFFFFFSMLFLCFRFSCSWFSLYCIFLINRFNCVNCGDYKNIRIMHHQREKLSSNRFKCIINFFFLTFAYYPLSLFCFNTPKKWNSPVDNNETGMAAGILIFYILILAKAFSVQCRKHFSLSLIPFKIFEHKNFHFLSAFSKSITLQLPHSAEWASVRWDDTKIDDGHTQKKGIDSKMENRVLKWNCYIKWFAKLHN